MNAFGNVLVDRADKIAVDVVCHEGDHGSCKLADGFECGVESHISVDLILLKTLCPEAFSASANVPVTHIVNKALESSCGFGDSVVAEIAVNGVNEAVQL